MTKFLNISTDDSLGGVSASDVVVASQKAIKAYVDAQVSGGSIDEKSITKNTDDELQAVGVINNRDNSTAIKTWTGTLAQYNAIETKDNNTIYNITDDTNNNVIYQNGSRNVGDIFYTTRTDTALNGAVRCNGNTYQTTDFLGDNNIGILLRTNKVMYVSMADYATEIATNGVCGKFGWDGGDTTAFKVPTLNDVFLEASNSSNGSFVSAGLPNITGDCSQREITGTATNVLTESTGAFYNSGQDRPSGAQLAIDGNYQQGTFGFDASRSSSIYGNSTTVQPNSVKYAAYVQLSTGATDTAISTCTSVSADVSSLNAHRVIAFQEPTAENNYTWYRKYADGWVEQGGVLLTTGSATEIQTTMPISMIDTNFSVVTGSLGQAAIPAVTTITTTLLGFVGCVANVGYFSFKFNWQVNGMYAQE